MGIFARKNVKSGDELTFDYKFEQLEGTQPQPCYCGESVCKGVIGISKESKENAKTHKRLIESSDESDNDLENEIKEEFVSVEQKRELEKKALEDSDEDEELWLIENSEDETIIIPVLQCIKIMPIQTRNTVDENKIEPILIGLSRKKDEFIADLSTEILKNWSSLKFVYKIPKRKPGKETNSNSRSNATTNNEETVNANATETSNNSQNGDKSISQTPDLDKKPSLADLAPSMANSWGNPHSDTSKSWTSQTNEVSKAWTTQSDSKIVSWNSQSNDNSVSMGSKNEDKSKSWNSQTDSKIVSWNSKSNGKTNSWGSQDEDKPKSWSTQAGGDSSSWNSQPTDSSKSWNLNSGGDSKPRQSKSYNESKSWDSAPMNKHKPSDSRGDNQSQPWDFKPNDKSKSWNSKPEESIVTWEDQSNDAKSWNSGFDDKAQSTNNRSNDRTKSYGSGSYDKSSSWNSNRVDEVKSWSNHYENQYKSKNSYSDNDSKPWDNRSDKPKFRKNQHEDSTSSWSSHSEDRKKSWNSHPDDGNKSWGSNYSKSDIDKEKIVPGHPNKSLGDSYDSNLSYRPNNINSLRTNDNDTYHKKTYGSENPKSDLHHPKKPYVSNNNSWSNSEIESKDFEGLKTRAADAAHDFKSNSSSGNNGWGSSNSTEVNESSFETWRKYDPLSVNPTNSKTSTNPSFNSWDASNNSNPPSNDTSNNGSFNGNKIKTNGWGEQIKTSTEGLSNKNTLSNPIETSKTALAEPVLNTCKYNGRRLKPGWYPASSDRGEIYFFHESSKQVQWDPPYIDGDIKENGNDHATNPHSGNSRNKKTVSPSKTKHESAKKVSFDKESLKKSRSDSVSKSNRPSKKSKTNGSTDHSSENLSKSQLMKLEKKATANLAKIVVNIMVKMGVDFLEKEDFKHEARKITRILFEKEKKSAVAKKKSVDFDSLIEISSTKSKKISEFIHTYISKLKEKKANNSTKKEAENADLLNSETKPTSPPKINDNATHSANLNTNLSEISIISVNSSDKH
ncbi:hypothetical protein AYI68_g1219 [Smittium mucronatum]|uniref:Histone-lysine N-methyltransferase SETD2 n=1 Tax=Smittium mucronatum TaxID=133383 RepID=A0A1R0H615_9FUNG|nr:hypothetical protein AYI68_g1219 [Smittium mucronatum]